MTDPAIYKEIQNLCQTLDELPPLKTENETFRITKLAARAISALLQERAALKAELAALTAELEPRSGHTFASLQKMWEDTHTELAKVISEREELKEQAEPALHNANKERNEAVRHLVSERDTLRANLERTDCHLGRALQAQIELTTRAEQAESKCAVFEEALERIQSTEMAGCYELQRVAIEALEMVHLKQQGNQ
jgi:chromosome segregation ATPase